MNGQGAVWLGLLVVGLAVGCEQPQRPRDPTVEDPSTSPRRDDDGEAAPATSTRTESALVLPDVVTTFHRASFEADKARTKLGVPLGIVTLHDAAFDNGFFHVLALFERGEVGTWRQTPGQPPDQMFLAQLSPPQLATAKEHLVSFAASPTPSASTAKGMVMGVTARLDDATVTRFFDDAALPEHVSRWVSLLQARLEATNGG